MGKFTTFDKSCVSDCVGESAVYDLWLGEHAFLKDHLVYEIWFPETVCALHTTYAYTRITHDVGKKNIKFGYGSQDPLGREPLGEKNPWEELGEEIRVLIMTKGNATLPSQTKLVHTPNQLKTTPNQFYTTKNTPYPFFFLKKRLFRFSHTKYNTMHTRQNSRVDIVAHRQNERKYSTPASDRACSHPKPT